MVKHYVIRLLLSLVVLLVTMEIGLQVASLVLPALLVRSDDELAGAADITILCVGDSHTFGAPLPSQDAYPAQLSEVLNATSSDRRVRVVNLGIPGQNSAMVANRLEKQVNYYRPDLVIAWIGLNNSWNFNEFDLDRTDGSTIKWRRWLLRSKVLRLIIVSGFREAGVRPTRTQKLEGDSAPSGGQEWNLGGEVIEIPLPPLPQVVEAPSQDSIRVQREKDYARIIGMTKAYEVPLVLLTYPLEILVNQRATNVAVRSEAERAEIPVVASSDAFKRAMADGHTGPDLIVDAVGPHPTRLLYRYLVDLLSLEVERQLTESRTGG